MTFRKTFRKTLRNILMVTMAATIFATAGCGNSKTSDTQTEIHTEGDVKTAVSRKNYILTEFTVAAINAKLSNCKIYKFSPSAKSEDVVKDLEKLVEFAKKSIEEKKASTDMFSKLSAGEISYGKGECPTTNNGNSLEEGYCDSLDSDKAYLNSVGAKGDILVAAHSSFYQLKGLATMGRSIACKEQHGVGYFDTNGKVTTEPQQY